MENVGVLLAHEIRHVFVAALVEEDLTVETAARQQAFLERGPTQREPLVSVLEAFGQIIFILLLILLLLLIAVLGVLLLQLPELLFEVVDRDLGVLVPCRDQGTVLHGPDPVDAMLDVDR